MPRFCLGFCTRMRASLPAMAVTLLREPIVVRVVVPEFRRCIEERAADGDPESGLQEPLAEETVCDVIQITTEASQESLTGPGTELSLATWSLAPPQRSLRCFASVGRSQQVAPAPPARCAPVSRLPQRSRPSPPVRGRSSAGALAATPARTSLSLQSAPKDALAGSLSSTRVLCISRRTVRLEVHQRGRWLTKATTTSSASGRFTIALHGARSGGFRVAVIANRACAGVLASRLSPAPRATVITRPSRSGLPAASVTRPAAEAHRAAEAPSSSGSPSSGAGTGARKQRC